MLITKQIITAIMYIKKIILKNKFKFVVNFPHIYSFLSKLWHLIQNFFTKIWCKIEKVKYFPPTKPTGYYKSQFGQDKTLEKLGLLKSNGVFVEVGCNHPINNSNSFFLEKVYSYSGISVDVIDYGNEFLKLRPRTKFINCAIDSVASQIDMYFVEESEGWESQMTTAHPKTLNSGRGFKGVKRIIPCKRLSHICKELKKIDLLMIDVEGHEFEVIKSFDWESSSPRVILIENNGVNFSRSKLRKLIKKLNYKLIALIGSSDEIYLYEGDI